MKKAVLILVFVTCALAGWGVYYTLKNFNRYKNPEAPRPNLIIYTHSSFMDTYGPGPELKERFEAKCLCNVRFEDVGSGQMLLEKIIIDQDKVVDLVLGFDQLMLKSAVQLLKWKKIKPPVKDFEPIYLENKYEVFIPYNWSPMAFIYRGEANTEKIEFFKYIETLEDHSISFPNPTTSTPGQLLALWVYDLSGRNDVEFARNLSLLKKKLKLQGADWSASYGMFRKEQVQSVWSFLTSLLYHWRQGELDFHARVFAEGHPVQLDYAAIPDNCMSCGLAQNFIHFLLEPEQQRLLIEKNYMRPVIKLEDRMLERLPNVDAYKFENLDELVDKRGQIIRMWNSVVQ